MTKSLVPSLFVSVSTHSGMEKGIFGDVYAIFLLLYMFYMSNIMYIELHLGQLWFTFILKKHIEI